MSLNKNLPVEIINVDYLDKYEGTVKFMTESGKVYEAMFWGNTFKPGERREIRFNHSCLKFDWEATFNMNLSKEKKSEKLEKDLEYIGYGQIEQINPVIACFGDIWLDLGSWASDERVINEYIYWRIDRLEII